MNSSTLHSVKSACDQCGVDRLKSAVLLFLIVACSICGHAISAEENSLESFRAQLHSCWKRSVTASNKSIVELRVQLRRNGTISAEPTLLNTEEHPSFRTAAESAIQAVKRCQPYRLPEKSYDTWRDVVITFDPFLSEHVHAARTRFSRSHYMCTIKSAYEFKNGKINDFGNIVDLHKRHYLNERFMVNRMTGEMVGAINSASWYGVEVLDFGSDEWSYKSITRSHTSHPDHHRHVIYFEVQEYAPGADKPFFFKDSSTILTGTCEGTGDRIAH